MRTLIASGALQNSLSIIGNEVKQTDFENAALRRERATKMGVKLDASDS